MQHLIEQILGPSVKHKKRINELIKPLIDHFDLSYFYCFKVSNEGKYCFFGNQLDWSEHFFAAELYHKYAPSFNPASYKPGLNIHLLNQQAFFNDVKDVANTEFGVNHMLELVYKDDKGIETYGFASKTNSDKILSFYLNEVAFLELFIKKLHEKHAAIYNDLEEAFFDMAIATGKDFNKNLLKPSDGINKEAFLKSLGISLTKRLSQREIDVIKYLIKGFPSARIGLELELSQRTVEKYIDNLKEKLDCYSKVEVFQKCVELDSVDYFGFKAELPKGTPNFSSWL